MEGVKLGLNVDPDVLYALTVRLYQSKDYENARNCASYLRQIDPLSARSYKILGQINQASGQYSWAIGAYQRAIIFNALDTDVLYCMAQCYMLLKEFGWAKKRLVDCLQLEPSHAGAKKMLESIKK